jgi:hypothetical protein
MTLKGLKNQTLRVTAGSPCWRPSVSASFEGVASEILTTSNMHKETPQSGNLLVGSIERPFGDYLFKRQ